MTATTPAFHALLSLVDDAIADLERAVSNLNGACWGPNDDPLIALPEDWYAEVGSRLQAVNTLLLETPDPSAVASSPAHPL